MQEEWRQGHQGSSSLVKHVGTDKESAHKNLLMGPPMTQALQRLRGLEGARGMNERLVFHGDTVPAGEDENF